MRLLVVAFLVMLSAIFCGCIETALVYNPNTYQTGRTAGKDHTKFRFSASMAQEVHSSPGGTGLETDMANQALALAGGLAVGVADRTDLGGALHFGFAGAGSTFGTRLYLKQMLTDRESTWAVSVLPAFAYEDGVNQTDEDTGSNISSNLFSLELHVPISYHHGRWFSAVIEPKLLWLNYSAPFTPGFHETNPNLHTQKKDWLCPGIGLGIKEGFIFPEVSFILVDGKVKTLGGVGFEF